MIIRLTVENYKSICSKQVLDMTSNSHTEKVDTNTLTWSNDNDSLTLLTTSAIYGANASGKSNLISALSVMRDMVINSSQWRAGKKLPYQPFKLSQSRKEPTEFEVEFIVDDIRYL